MTRGKPPQTKARITHPQHAKNPHPPPSRQYDPAPSGNTTYVAPYTGPDIGTFLPPLGKLDLLAYMAQYWVAQGQPSPAFWAHEFSKHATCYSTFDVACYGPQAAPHADVADFFATAVGWFRTLPTHAWLAAAGIVPSNATAYSLSDIQAALAPPAAFGALPYLACSGAKSADGSGYTALSEVWYCEFLCCLRGFRGEVRMAGRCLIC